MEIGALFERLIAGCRELGAFKAKVISVGEIVIDPAFREMCQANSCGMYGRCYMCPPDVGDIEALAKEVREYSYCLVYQTVTELLDSFDFEGMVEAKKKSYPLAQGLRRVFLDGNITEVLHLCVGGCGVCESCAKGTDEPCRHPELAMASLEAYGVNVSELARASGMKYINGQNTVTYFGAVLFNV